MFLFNFSPWIWDLIIAILLLSGTILGFFIGLRALTFVTIGNGIAIGLGFALKGIVLVALTNFLSGVLSPITNSIPDFQRLLVDNLASSLYWVLLLFIFNLVFWLAYLIIWLVWLRRVPIKKLKWYNRSFGAVLNFLRMSFLSFFIAMFSGNALLANTASKLDNQYLTNTVASDSFAYMVFSKIYPSFPLFNITNNDFYQLVNFKNYFIAITYTINTIQGVTTDDELEIALNNANTLLPLTSTELTNAKAEVQKVRDGTQSLAEAQIAIALIFKNHVNNDFLSIDFMVPKLKTIFHIISLYPETSNFIHQIMTSTDITIDTAQDQNWNTNLKPKINEFLDEITDANAKKKMTDAFQKLYNPY